MSGPLTLHDASAPLLSQQFSPQSSFAQSGSWSWVGLIDSGVRGAISVLSRYSAAGVDQYTMIVGQLLCSQFQLSLQGSERLKNAIMGLKSMNTVGNMLHFGFGVDSVVRNLAATQEGGVLVAMCAATVEAYTMDFGADLFWELMKSFDPPERRIPSPMQWKSLIKACAGILAETNFPRLVEHFMQLHTNNNQLSVRRYQIQPDPADRGVSSADTIAAALLAIGKISTGQYLSISIIGGADAGWLAAIAQWLFDLNVAIYDSNGELLYVQSVQNRIQVHVVFVKPTESDQGVFDFVQGKTFKLRDITEMFALEMNEFGPALVCSRVAWSHALEKTFGADFKKLMEMRRSFGQALISAGHIFDAVARADAGVSMPELKNCRTYYSDARGRGFMTFAIALLPELEPLNQLGDVSSIKSFKDACETFDRSCAHIAKGCGCSVCTSKDFDEKSFCLVLLLETILALIHCMTGISVSAEMYPMRSGIESFYRRQLKLHESETFESRIEKYGRVGSLLEFHSQECHEEWNMEESVAVPRLVLAARLFTGRNIESCDHAQVAISVYGVVVFLNNLLQDGISMDPESMGRCTVISGHIEMHGRLYDHLQDLSDFDVTGMDYRHQFKGGLAPDPIVDESSLESLDDDYVRVTLTVKEGTGTARVGFLIHKSHEDGPNKPTVVIGPAELTQHLSEATGIVHCDGKSCRLASVPRYSAVSESVKMIEQPGQCKTWVFEGNRFGQSVALRRIVDVAFLPGFYAIVQHNECINCCINAAELSEYERAFIIAGKKHSNRKRLLENAA